MKQTKTVRIMTRCGCVRDFEVPADFPQTEFLQMPMVAAASPEATGRVRLRKFNRIITDNDKVMELYYEDLR